MSILSFTVYLIRELCSMAWVLNLFSTSPINVNLHVLIMCKMSCCFAEEFTPNVPYKELYQIEEGGLPLFSREVAASVVFRFLGFFLPSLLMPTSVVLENRTRDHQPRNLNYQPTESTMLGFFRNFLFQFNLINHTVSMQRCPWR